jgi:hypothetical protein
MKWTIALIMTALAAGCASFDGRGLTPGTSASEVEAVMGPAADKRVKGSETWLYYPRQPYGYANYVARIGQDGKLIALEQRLTDENVAKIERNKSTADDVRELMGPPYTAMNFARMQRDIWEYRYHSLQSTVPYALYVQFSPDGVAREVYQMSDPDYRLSDALTR